MAIKKLLYILLFLLIACQGDDTASEMDSTDDMQVAEFELITIPLSGITQIKATAAGAINGVLLNEIEELGFVYSTSPGPSTNDTTIAAAMTLNFTVQLVNLDVNTQYFVRAYAIINRETRYGNELSFSTLEHKEFNGIPTLTSQADVDSFFAEAYSKILGFIIEEEVAGDITNLNALSTLVEIGTATNVDYAIRILNNSSLTDLSGLENLRAWKGGGVISGNKISDLSVFSQIERIDGSFSISNEPLLANLNGLSNIIEITGELQIINNSSLLNLSGLENLNRLGQDLSIIGNVNLTDFCGLENLINNDFSGVYAVFSNAFNPTQEDIENGNCSL
jgi:hypothetical protein